MSMDTAEILTKFISPHILSCGSKGNSRQSERPFVLQKFTWEWSRPDSQKSHLKQEKILLDKFGHSSRLSSVVLVKRNVNE